MRVALALACATRQDVRIENVRAHRAPPGLKPQHVAAARLLCEVTEGEVVGADAGSTTVELRPGLAVGGEYEYRLTTAGSVTLLLQAVLPVCAASGQAFTFRLVGGTDVPLAPTWDYFTRVHLPQLDRIGFQVEAQAQRRGFYPQGGGEVILHARGAALHPASFLSGARPPGVVGHAIAHALPRHVIERAASAARDALRDAGFPAEFELEQHRGPGRGMSLSAWCDGGSPAPLGACAVGRRGRTSEDVGLSVATALAQDLKAQAGVDEHSADQLLVFMALAGGGEFTTRKLSRHARTVIDLLPRFLPVKVEVADADGVQHVRLRAA